MAEKQGSKIYVQVAYKLENPQTAEREFSELVRIADQYRKFVVTMDEFWKEFLFSSASSFGFFHFFFRFHSILYNTTFS